ncbi:MAG: PRC-barrel domain-containing protein, partial [Candidatus Hodarchaeota archaeon]
MLRQKKGFLASEIFDYCILDRHSRKVGKIKDLLINPISHLIDYIITENEFIIPISLINDDDSAKKTIKLSQIKERLIQHNKISSVPKKCKYYSEMKKIMVYDITGEKLGPITN